MPLIRLRPRSTLSVLSCAALLGCTGFLFPPDHVDRVQEATRQERERCRSEVLDPRLFSAEIVESVAPLYRYVNSANSREARLNGAELRLRPLPGVTAELLGHALICGEARSVLGRSPLSPNDPYWLVDGWVKITVRSGDSQLVVALEGEDIVAAREILARARAFGQQAR